MEDSPDEKDIVSFPLSGSESSTPTFGDLKVSTKGPWKLVHVVSENDFKVCSGQVSIPYNWLGKYAVANHMCWPTMHWRTMWDI